MIKKLFAIALLMTCFGCASTGTFSDNMQPDGSYRIIAGGNAFASASDARNEAMMRALALCPNGYTKKSEMHGNDGLKPRHQLIIKCNE
jgi:hypothetical protein